MTFLSWMYDLQNYERFNAVMLDLSFSREKNTKKM